MKALHMIRLFLDKYFRTMLVTFFVFVIAAVIFFLTFPFNVAEFKKINLLNSVQAGSTIRYKVDYCQNVGAGVERHTRRFLVADDPNLTDPIELSSNPSLETLQNSGGCRTSKEIKLPIDASVPAGKYKLLIQVRYCILPVRCIPVEAYSDSFDIAKPDIPTQLSLIYEQLDQIQRAVSPQSVGTGAITANAIQVQNAPTGSTTEEVVVNPQTPSTQSEQASGGIIQATRGIVDNLIGIIGL